MKTLKELLDEARSKGLLPSNDQPIPELYATDGVPEKDKNVVYKFGATWTKWRWYATEASPVDEDGCMIGADAPPEEQAKAVDYLFFGYVAGDYPEWGYFSLTEMLSVKHPVFGGLRYDAEFTPKNFMEAVA